jgi:hypothetical protein
MGPYSCKNIPGDREMGRALGGARPGWLREITRRGWDHLARVAWAGGRG